MKRSRFKNDKIFTIISGDITGSSIDKLFQNIMRVFVGDLPQADEFPAFVNVQSGGYLTLSRISGWRAQPYLGMDSQSQSR